MLEVEKHLPLRDYSLFPKYVGCANLFSIPLKLLCLTYFPQLNYLLPQAVKEQGNEMQTQFREYFLQISYAPVP